jgi:hypothetical protein
LLLLQLWKKCAYSQLGSSFSVLPWILLSCSQTMSFQLSCLFCIFCLYSVISMPCHSVLISPHANKISFLDTSRYDFASLVFLTVQFFAGVFYFQCLHFFNLQSTFGPLQPGFHSHYSFELTFIKAIFCQRQRSLFCLYYIELFRGIWHIWSPAFLKYYFFLWALWHFISFFLVMGEGLWTLLCNLLFCFCIF